MSLWDTVKTALGLRRAPAVRAWEPAQCSPAALRRLARLPAGSGVQVQTRPERSLRRVQITEAPLTAQPHPDFGGAAVQCSAEDAAHLRGLTLDHDGARWLVTTQLTVHAAETPNRDGRLYLTDRTLSAEPLQFVRLRPDLPHLAAALLQRDDVRGVFVRAHTLTVERTPGAPWPAIDAAVIDAARAHVLGCGGTLRAPPPDLREDPLFEAVRQVLAEQVAPAVHRDGGDLRLVDVADGIAYVSLIGACRTCPASASTLKRLVETSLQRAFPDEVHEVRAVEHDGARE
jgi:Fe-S cluster biogenesis protein NfuA